MTSVILPETGSVNSEGRMDVVQHSHPYNGWIQADFDLAASLTQDFIILDISDTTNYPHDDTGYIHIEYFAITIDAATNAAYTIEFGYLENVDGTDGDFHEVFHFSGTKSTGNQLLVDKSFAPNGPQLTSARAVSSDKSLNDTAFQTDVNLASTLDPSTADTPSGDRDMVMRVVLTGGDINVSVNMSYHTHAAAP